MENCNTEETGEREGEEGKNKGKTEVRGSRKGKNGEGAEQRNEREVNRAQEVNKEGSEKEQLLRLSYTWKC